MRRGTVAGWAGIAAAAAVAGLLFSGTIAPGSSGQAGATSAGHAAAGRSGNTVDQELAAIWVASRAPAGVPEPYRQYFPAALTECPQLPGNILAAQLYVESLWDPHAVSFAGAQGLAQFLPSTWALYGVDGNGDGVADPFEPADAIRSAARYDCALLTDTQGVPGQRYANMLAAYHAGPAAVAAAGGIPDIPMTQTYVARVLASAVSISVEN